MGLTNGHPRGKPSGRLAAQSNLLVIRSEIPREQPSPAGRRLGRVREPGLTGSGLDRRTYAEQDANWNVTSLADDSGLVQQRLTYDACGGSTLYPEELSVPQNRPTNG